MAIVRMVVVVVVGRMVAVVVRLVMVVVLASIETSDWWKVK